MRAGLHRSRPHAADFPADFSAVTTPSPRRHRAISPLSPRLTGPCRAHCHAHAWRRPGGIVLPHHAVFPCTRARRSAPEGASRAYEAIPRRWPASSILGLRGNRRGDTPVRPAMALWRQCRARSRARRDVGRQPSPHPRRTRAPALCQRGTPQACPAFGALPHRARPHGDDCRLRRHAGAHPRRARAGRDTVHLRAAPCLRRRRGCHDGRHGRATPYACLLDLSGRVLRGQPDESPAGVRPGTDPAPPR